MSVDLRSQINSHPVIKPLLKNPAWKPVAQAAINFFVDNKDTKIDYWKKSDVWKQVETVFNELNKPK